MNMTMELGIYIVVCIMGISFLFDIIRWLTPKEEPISKMVGIVADMKAMYGRIEKDYQERINEMQKDINALRITVHQLKKK
jgi:hypothetical protein